MDNPIPREQAIDLLQELISKASIRLHAALRKQTPPTHAEDPLSKAATPRQMRRLLDRLGCEAYKELENNLVFQAHDSNQTSHATPTGGHHPPRRSSGGASAGMADQQSCKAASPAMIGNGITQAKAADASCNALGTGSATKAVDATLSSLCAALAQASRNAAQTAVALPEYHSVHNVHPDQRTEYLGPSKRAGSPSRPSCFDVYQGYRQRGASMYTDRNLREQDSGVAVCWVPGGRHQGTFNKVGAIQAATGISRKTCTGCAAWPCTARQ